MIRLKNLLKESFNESDAGEEAKKMGLVHKGWGRYADPKSGQVTHQSQDGRLVPVDSPPGSTATTQTTPSHGAPTEPTSDIGSDFHSQRPRGSNENPGVQDPQFSDEEDSYILDTSSENLEQNLSKLMQHSHGVVKNYTRKNDNFKVSDPKEDGSYYIVPTHGNSKFQKKHALKVGPMKGSGYDIQKGVALGLYGTAEAKEGIGPITDDGHLESVLNYYSRHMEKKSSGFVSKLKNLISGGGARREDPNTPIHQTKIAKKILGSGPPRSRMNNARKFRNQLEDKMGELSSSGRRGEAEKWMLSYKKAKELYGHAKKEYELSLAPADVKNSADEVKSSSFKHMFYKDGEYMGKVSADGDNAKWIPSKAYRNKSQSPDSTITGESVDVGHIKMKNLIKGGA